MAHVVDLYGQQSLAPLPVVVSFSYCPGLCSFIPSCPLLSLLVSPVSLSGPLALAQQNAIKRFPIKYT